MFKKIKTLKNNNALLTQRNMDLNKFCVKLQQENNELTGKNMDLEHQCIMLGEQLAEKKKECKELKRILTVNKISYKKEK